MFLLGLIPSTTDPQPLLFLHFALLNTINFVMCTVKMDVAFPNSFVLCGAIFEFWFFLDCNWTLLNVIKSVTSNNVANAVKTPSCSFPASDVIL